MVTEEEKEETFNPMETRFEEVKKAKGKKKKGSRKASKGPE